MLTADNWCVKVHDRVYGPYTSQQLRKFAHEGRLAGWSLIAPAGSRDWREARRENTFSEFFGTAQDQRVVNTGTAFGRRLEGETAAKPARRDSQHHAQQAREPARRVPQAANGPAERPGAAPGTAPARQQKPLHSGPRPVGAPKRARPIGQFGNDARAGDLTGPANFVVIFDVVSGAAGRVETAMHGIGPAFRIADNVWTVHCSLTTIGVRNAIAPYLRASESIFVIDTTHGRTSWQNYAPEAHAKLAAAFLARKVAS